MRTSRQRDSEQGSAPAPGRLHAEEPGDGRERRLRYAQHARPHHCFDESRRLRDRHHERLPRFHRSLQRQRIQSK